VGSILSSQGLLSVHGSRMKCSIIGVTTMWRLISVSLLSATLAANVEPPIAAPTIASTKQGISRRSARRFITPESLEHREFAQSSGEAPMLDPRLRAFQLAKFVQVPPNQGAAEPDYPIPSETVPAALPPSATGAVRSAEEIAADNSAAEQAAADAAAMAAAQAALVTAVAAPTGPPSMPTNAPQAAVPQAAPVQPAAAVPQAAVPQAAAPPQAAVPQAAPVAQAKTWSVWTPALLAPTTTTRSSGSRICADPMCCGDPTCVPTPLRPGGTTMAPAYGPPPTTTTPAPRKITPEQALVLDAALSGSQAKSAYASLAGSAASAEARGAYRAAGAAANAASAATAVAASAVAKVWASANDLTNLRGMRVAAGMAHSEQLNNIHLPAPRWPEYVPLPPVPPR